MATKTTDEKQIAHFEVRDFSGGLVDKVDDALLPENASSDCCNFISDTIGKLRKRPGQLKVHDVVLGGVVKGLHPYYHNNTSTLVAVANGVASVCPIDGEFASIKTGLNTKAQTHFETCINYMVAFNGVDAPWKYDGTDVTPLANAPAKGRLAILHKEQLFTVDADTPSTLRWSELVAPEIWPALHQARIKEGDGDEITNLQKFIGELLVFKRRSVHTLSGNTIDDFQQDELESRIGCVGGFAAVVKGAYVYFVSDEGLCAFNGMKVINLSENKIPVFWSTVNKQYLHNAAVGYWGSYVWFAIPTGTSTTNNTTVLYEVPQGDIADGRFWPCTGINASCFITYDTEDVLGFYSGGAADGYVRQQWTGTEDDGVPVAAYWVGKYYNVQVPEFLKKAKKIFVTDSPDTHNTVSLALSFDYKGYINCSLRASDGLVREFRMPSASKFRYVSPKITHSSAGACEVRGILMPCKVKMKPKVNNSAL